MDLMTYLITEEGLLISTERSRVKVLGNIQNIEKGIKLNFEMCEKAITYLKEFAEFIFSHEFKGTANDQKACVKKANEFRQKMTDIDYGRGSDKELLQISKAYLKRSMNKKFNLADYRREDVKTAELELQRKCSTGGEYHEKGVRLTKAFQSLENFVEKGVKKLPKNNDLIAALLQVYTEEHNWAKSQTFLSVNDVARSSK